MRRPDDQARPRFVLLLAALLMLLSQVGLCAAKAPEWSAGGRKPDPATVLPLEQIAEQHRGNVADVIRNHTLHRRGAPDTFPANPRIYLALLEQPVLTLSLWKDVGESPARLQQTGPGRFVGSDGSGTSASWEYLIKSPRLHVMLCELDYVSPRGAARLTGRIVLILRTGYFKETGGESWIRHEVEAFVKVDSTAWKALAVTLRPIVESVLEDQVQEAGLFISLMARLVETYPDWATGVAQQAYLPADAKKSFGEIVKQTRRPGAFTTRPMMADGRSSDSPARRR